MVALIVVVVPVAVALHGLRHRKRTTQRHERNAFAGTYAVLLACMAGLVLYLTFTAARKVDTVAHQEHPSVVIKAVGSSWKRR
jgi:heme/copper-type cytochrome/quinol oxidase subunit 2